MLVVLAAAVGNCRCCRLLKDSKKTFQSAVTKREFRVSNKAGPGCRKLSCKSSNIVYLTSCAKCGAQYVGQTGQSLNERINHVRSQGIKFNKQLNQNNPPISQLSCPHLIAHFFHPKSKCNWKEHARVQPIEVLSEAPDEDKTAHRLQRETFWIRTLRTVYPYGLNVKSKDGEEKANIQPLSVEKSFLPIERKRFRKRGSKKKKGDKQKLQDAETLYAWISSKMYTDKWWRHEL